MSGANNDKEILCESQTGHVEAVQPASEGDRVDPSAYGNSAILDVSSYGHVEVLRLLLEGSNAGDF